MYKPDLALDNLQYAMKPNQTKPNFSSVPYSAHLLTNRLPFFSSIWTLSYVNKSLHSQEK